MKQTPRAKIIRRALGLTQEEFAAQFQIPLGTLRDWEQGAAEPDQAARAYLKVIAVDPEAVRKALQVRPEPALTARASAGVVRRGCLNRRNTPDRPIAPYAVRPL